MGVGGGIFALEKLCRCRCVFEMSSPSSIFLIFRRRKGTAQWRTICILREKSYGKDIFLVCFGIHENYVTSDRNMRKLNHSSPPRFAQRRLVYAYNRKINSLISLVRLLFHQWKRWPNSSVSVGLNVLHSSLDGA